MNNHLSLGLKGRLSVEVLNGGQVMAGPVVSPNLWLDQGLDNLAAHPICDLFAVAVKGFGTTPTTEDLTGTSNTYSIPNGSTVMTRTAGTRDFTVDEVGKLIRFTTGEEFRINGYTSATVVSVTPAASPAITNKKGTLYRVGSTGMDNEVNRTKTYSMVAGENATTTAGNVRTFKRTFLFPVEDRIRETVDSSNTYTQTGNTVTHVVGPRAFSGADVGRTITFVNSGSHGVITGLGTGDAVVLDSSAENPVAGPVFIDKDSGLVESVTGTYSRAGTTVTRASGTRNFTSADVGKILHFNTAGTEAIITVYTDATHVTVDTSGTVAAQAITLYGFTDYLEFGFSHSEEESNSGNLNIRVLLPAAVRAYVSTPLRASDQVKATYQCTLTVTPNTVTAGNLNTVINDPANGMSGNKSGNYVIETFATSTVSASGGTDVSLVDLEPYYEGSAGLSLNTDALAPLTGKVRSTSLASVPMVGEVYHAGSFSRVYTAVFGLNDAVNSNWRSLMAVDPSSQLAIFTFLFAAAQKKDGEHTLTISFRKTWGRDLS